MSLMPLVKHKGSRCHTKDVIAMFEKTGLSKKRTAYFKKPLK